MKRIHWVEAQGYWTVQTKSVYLLPLTFVIPMQNTNKVCSQLGNSPHLTKTPGPGLHLGFRSNCSPKLGQEGIWGLPILVQISTYHYGKTFPWCCHPPLAASQWEQCKGRGTEVPFSTSFTSLSSQQWPLTTKSKDRWKKRSRSLGTHWQNWKKQELGTTGSGTPWT